jgi:hypothetical protein
VVGLVAGTLALLIDSQLVAWQSFLLVAAPNAIWGYALAGLGRRGYLPFPDEE